MNNSVTRMSVSGKSNNRYNIFKDEEEEDKNGDELTEYEDKDDNNRKEEIEKDEKLN